MIRSAAIVLSIAILADFLAAQLAVPVPGAAFGLVGLTAVFLMLGRADSGVALLYDWVSPHFALFFVPAATGLIATGDTLASAWIEALFAVAFGTAATIAVTGLVAQTFFRAVARIRTA